jgi:hypothetical protein
MHEVRHTGKEATEVTVPWHVNHVLKWGLGEFFFCKFYKLIKILKIFGF